jgi:tetratricopeptide (TPR) repeat protein
MKRILLWILLAGLSYGAVGQEYLVRARGALANRDTAAALQNLSDALKAGSKLGEVNYLLGAIAYNRGKLDEAIPYLQASVRYDDENADALAILGLALAEQKDLPGALTHLRRAEKFGKKNPNVLLALGRAFLAADSLDAAIQRLTLAKEYDPENPTIYGLLGDAFVRQNVPPLAISNYQEVIRLTPKDVATRAKLAKVFEDQRNYTEAVRVYDDVLVLDSTNTTAMLAKGKILVRAKLFQRAIGPLKRYTEVFPKSVEGSQYYAKALSGTGYFVDAAKEGHRSLKLDSSNTDVWRLVAEALVETKDYPGALKAYEGLKRHKAFKNEDYAAYGNALVGVGKEDEALNALLSAVAADSTNCDPYYNLGSLYMKKRDYARAAAMFEKKIGCDPRSLGAYLNASACYLQPATKNYDRARELLMKTLEIRPDFLYGRLWLGRYYSQVDSLEQARMQYEEVLRQIGSNTDKYRNEAGEAHYMLGSSYFTTKQYARVVESMRRASQLGYDNAGLQLTWGQSLLQLLDPDKGHEENRRLIEEAISHFRRATGMEQSSAAAHLWLAQGLVLARVEGDNAGNAKLKEEACGEYRRVLRLDPGNADAKKGMERIGCPGAGK